MSLSSAITVTNPATRLTVTELFARDLVPNVVLCEPLFDRFGNVRYGPDGNPKVKILCTVSTVEHRKCGIHINGSMCYNTPMAPVWVQN